MSPSIPEYCMIVLTGCACLLTLSAVAIGAFGILSSLFDALKKLLP